MSRLIAGAAACVLVTASAPAAAQTSPSGAPDAPPARQCFYGRNIQSWSEVDDRRVILRANVRDNYLVELVSPCPEIRTTETLGVRNRSSDWICTRDRFDLLVQDISRRDLIRCPVARMTPITSEAAAELTRKRR